MCARRMVFAEGKSVMNARQSFRLNKPLSIIMSYLL